VTSKDRFLEIQPMLFDWPKLAYDPKKIRVE